MARIRGVFFTFGGFFLVMLVVILALLVAKTLNQSNDRLTESGSLERVFALSNSLDKMIAKVDNGITYDLTWDSTQNLTILTITEDLDSEFNDYGNSFNSNMQDLINFVEGNQPEISFDYPLIYNSTNKIPLIIKPNGILYTHFNNAGENVLIISPVTAMPVINLEIELNSENLDVNGIQWTTQNFGSNSSISITVSDSVGGSDSISEMIDETQINVFTINNDLTITVGELCDSCIEINRGGINITSTFSTPLIYVGEQTTIHYPKATYQIDFEDIGIFLNNTPRIL